MERGWTTTRGGRRALRKEADRRAKLRSRRTRARRRGREGESGEGREAGRRKRRRRARAARGMSRRGTSSKK